MTPHPDVCVINMNHRAWTVYSSVLSGLLKLDSLWTKQ